MQRQNNPFGAKVNWIAANLHETVSVVPDINERIGTEPINSVMGLTEYADDNAKVSVTEEAFQSLVTGHFNPYSPDNVDNLSRDYLVDRTVWAPADAVGALKVDIHLPEDIINSSTFVEQRLANYFWFRCSCHVTIRLNTTKYHYGSLLVSYLPFYYNLSTQAARSITLGQCVQNNGMILSANTDEVLEFDVPFLAPMAWMGVGSVNLTGHEGIVGSVMIHVLNPLSSASPSPPAGITINTYARMVNVEVAGPAPNTVVAEYIPQSGRRKAQKPSNTKEAEQKAESNVITDTLDSAVTIVPKVIEFITTLVGGVEKLAPLLALVLDKPSYESMPQPTFVDTDADIGYVDGIDLSHKLSLHHGAQSSNDVHAMTGLTHEGIYDLCRRPGLLCRFSFDSTTAVDTTIQNIYCRPLAMVTAVSGTKTYITPTPISYWSCMFKYWRGGLKYMIHFNTSSFTTSRVRIVWYPGSGFAPGGGDYTGDVISRIVDVTGDTWVSFVVPYLHPEYYMPNVWAAVDYAGSFQTGQINISLVNPVVTPATTGTASVFASVFVAAAEDFTLMNYLGFRFPYGLSGASLVASSTLPTEDIETEYEPQSSIGVKFKAPFDGLNPAKFTKIDRFFTDDRVTTVEDLGKLYRPMTIGGGTLQAATDYQHTAPFPQVELYYPFLFWRGSLRIKQLTAATSTNSVLGNASAAVAVALEGVMLSPYDNLSRTYCGTTWGKPVATAELPFFCRFLYQETNSTHHNGATYHFLDPLEFVQTFTTAAPAQEFSAFGDDYCLIYPTAVPIMYWTTPEVPKATPLKTTFTPAPNANQRALALKRK